MSTPVVFRHAQVEDALCISGLATQVFLDTYATDGMRADLAEEALSTYAPQQFRQRLADPRKVLLLAERAGHLLGFAELGDNIRPPLAQLSQGMELVRLYVQRHAHRQGIGQALLDRAESLAQARQASCLWLTAWDGNHPALAFYLAQGYDAVGTTHYEFGGNRYGNQVFCKTW
ncbi:MULTISPECIES: GNAT family N-acetyltransferase [Pseudomonas]|uniref:GNAT family N-acetyltransferase n=1 Tax=Pseudomonas sessilinigenes TaxID=658629 RepID=A0ABX8MU99_9PSED|nr:MULTISPECIES: GNAT family N-acetyltransferase [Pseudomonas]AZC23767.1 acetyltransferase, GNAT family [Pseudomonas sessilinigenes]QIH09249.1 GNAT family N-acetyltransferase [Pseudomonas sp. BIOMIG1BAC]QXH42754.1 GNAT family N-acetyltransferase [Pseudomonas sessilinigenes]UMZ14035.1 GNAT family N-acetyltransferase [Pseudomonas sp. MPFS]